MRSRPNAAVQTRDRRRSAPPRDPMRVLVFAAMTAALALILLAACGSSGGTTGPTATVTVTAQASPSPTTQASGGATPTAGGSASPSPTATMRLSTYFVRNAKVGVVHRWVPKTTMVATAAVDQLLQGLTASEHGSGVYSTIPAGTDLLGLTISGGVATVDLSSAFSRGSSGAQSRGLRVAQVVFTATQFPTVESVRVKVEGAVPSGFAATGLDLAAPLTRSDLETYTPAILVESPAINDTIASPVNIWGTANTFEGSFMAQVMNAAGDRIVAKPVQATSGSGTRGTFSKSISYSTADDHGLIVVYEVSAKDGTPVHVVRIPVKFAH
jgi:germination protein M